MPKQYNPEEMFKAAPPEPTGLTTSNTVTVTDKPALSARQVAEIDQANERERKKAEFVRSVLEARKVKEIVHAPQPVASRVLEQTRLEQEAGRKAVEAATAAKKQFTPPKEDPGVTPVFRPADYVPDMKHGDTKGRLLR